ncbi:MAG: hypothetical protein BroJett025_02190 [Patescibacteria group bacterium]|nr:MAG: hypothetical protein BroJett025_02190 [Patescibacteria group bacterium]
MLENLSPQPGSLVKEQRKSELGFTVTTFTPNKEQLRKQETIQGEQIAVIVFPGAGDTAAVSEKMSESVVQNLLQEQVRRQKYAIDGNFKVAAAIHMPSLVSKDVIDASGDRDTKMQGFVKMIAAVLKEHPAQKVFLVGQSMGGQNLPELVSLFKTQFPNITIAGSVFFQSGGLFEQGIAEFNQGLGKSNQLEHELAQNFPTKLDISELEERIREAKNKYDTGLALKLTQDLEQMKANYNAKYAQLKQNALAETERTVPGKKGLPASRIGHKKIESLFQKIEQLTTEIEQRTTSQETESPETQYDYKAIKRAQALRRKLLMEIVNHLVADPVIGNTWKPLSVLIEAGRESFLSKRKINKQVQVDLAENFDFPVAVAWSQQDAVFPAQKAQTRTGLLSKVFNKASKLYDVVVENLGHKPHSFNPEKFGQVVSDIITRIQFDEQENSTTALRY